MSPGRRRVAPGPPRLSLAGLRSAAADLAGRDPDLGAIYRRLGPPPLWARRPGFSALVRIILEQQVSLASARAAFERLRGSVDRLTPRAFLGLDAARLRRIGFSRQKAGYCRELASAIVEGRLRLVEVARMSDAAARDRLMELPGIGRWSADIYLLMALRRPDVWPRGDLALARSAQRLKALRALPDDEELAALAEGWRPWRAVAARLLWHDYLSHRRRELSRRARR